MTRDTVRSSRAWNTWDPVHPAERIHLPSGAHVAVTAYSDALGRFTRLPPGHHNGVLLGPRTIDSEHIELSFDHGGTEIAVTITSSVDDALDDQPLCPEDGEVLTFSLPSHASGRLVVSLTP